MKLRPVTLKAIVGAACTTLAVLGAALTVLVRDEVGRPIAGAYVWADDTAPHMGRTDAAGRCVLTSMPARVVLVVARDGRYGRAQPQRANGATNVTLTFALPSLTTLRCGTYNRMGYDGWTTQQIAALTRIFWAIQLDVVCLQECPQTGVTVTTLKRQRMPGYTSVVSWVGGPIRNGILRLYPIVSVTSYTGGVMIRDAFTTRIDLPVMGDTTFISVHFKAGSTSNDGLIRNAKATYVGGLCSNWYHQGVQVFLAGDLNDDPAHGRPPSDVHGILARTGAGLVQLPARDDSGSMVAFPSGNRRYDFLYPALPWAAYTAITYIVRTVTMSPRPPWLLPGDSSTASDHCLVYADFYLIPEPQVLLAIVVGPVWKRLQRC